jgi:hypothetical protein
METAGNQIKPKTSLKYYCNYCDYTTSKKSNYETHIATSKHKKLSNGNILETAGNKIKPKFCSQVFACENCNKEFKNRSGLWKHNNKCIVTKVNNQQVSKYNNNEISQETILSILKQNSELQNMLIEQNKTIIELSKNNSITYSNNNNNSNNKTFNLQFFLNETCKDAMNIMDFVDSIRLQLSDLENVGKIGYVEGISNIIVKNLKDLDITERPIHCTDKKREILYIKDEDKWEKEDEEKKKIKKVIKHVANKNIRLLQKFKEAHPDCVKSASKFSDQYDKIIVEAMGGSGDNDLEKEEKIIQKITKNVTIDK